MDSHPFLGTEKVCTAEPAGLGLACHAFLWHIPSGSPRPFPELCPQPAAAGAAGRDREALGTGSHFKELLLCRKARRAKVSPGQLCCTLLGPVWPVAEQVPSQMQGPGPAPAGGILPGWLSPAGSSAPKSGSQGCASGLIQGQEFSRIPQWDWPVMWLMRVTRVRVKKNNQEFGKRSKPSCFRA